MGDIEEDKELIEADQEYDVYFEANSVPEGKWKDITFKNRNRFQETNKVWHGDNCFSDKLTYKYILPDNPDENQKLLNRCKEMVNILLILKDSEYNQTKLRHMEILQKYLTKKYLITRQIAWYIDHIKFLIIEELSVDPNNQYESFRNHPSNKYDFKLYKDNYDITKIKEDIAEFIRIKEDTILTPYECLLVYLKKHDNRITIKQYQLFTNKTNIVVRRILNNFVNDIAM